MKSSRKWILILKKKETLFFLITIFVSFFIQFSAFSQETLPKSKLNKQIKDTTIIEDDKLNLSTITDSIAPIQNTSSTFTQPIDTVKLYKPLSTHGSVFNISNNAFHTINKEDISFLQYSGLFDILRKELPVFPLSLGSQGQFNNLSFFGGTPRNVSFTFNNRPFNDLDNGSYNIEQWSPEFMESAEILIGSDAVVFSGSSGALINIKEIQYNTKTPYTRIWFAEGGYEFLGADGIFSQNIAPNWNFTFGFRNTSTQGRFSNSWLEAWNIRGLLRWTPSERTSISLVEYFTNHGLGANGGIDINNSPSIFDDLYAQTNFDNLTEKLFRHDITLTLTSLLTEDSSETITGTLFFSHANRHINRGDLFVTTEDTNSVLRYLSRQFGATAKYESNLLKFIKLRFGGEAYWCNLEKTVYNDKLKGLSYAAYTHGQLNPFKFIDISGGVRFGSNEGRTSFAFGAKSIFKFSKNFNASLDLSRSERLPSPVEGLSLGKESDYLGLADINLNIDNMKFTLGIFALNVSSPLLSTPVKDTNGRIITTSTYNGDTRFTAGSYILYKAVFIENLNISAQVQGYFSRTDSKEDKRFPLFYGTINSYYEILKGKSILRLGFNISTISDFKGEQFIPQTRSYIATNYSSQFANSGIEVYASARLGNAFVRISYENILSQGYYYVPFYPQLDRNFKLSVSWAFMD